MDQRVDKGPGTAEGARRATGDGRGIIGKGSRGFRPGARLKLSCASYGEKTWSYSHENWG